MQPIEINKSLVFSQKSFPRLRERYAKFFDTIVARRSKADRAHTRVLDQIVGAIRPMGAQTAWLINIPANHICTAGVRMTPRSRSTAQARGYRSLRIQPDRRLRRHDNGISAVGSVTVGVAFGARHGLTATALAARNKGV